MLKIPLALAAGASTWSLAEYWIHYLAGHKYARRKNFFSAEHVRHHATTSYFAPTSKKAAAATVAAALVGPLATALVGRRTGLAYTVGFVTAYVGYEIVHRRAHTHPPRGRYGRWLRRHHFHHHFHRPLKNHGVTSPIWDHLFGTYDPPSKIRVPARHAMVWLVDDEGRVRPELADDYEVVRKGAPPDAITAEVPADPIDPAQDGAPQAA